MIMIEEISFKQWVQNEILKRLQSKAKDPPTIFWCDPNRLWQEILEKISEGTFELWTEDDNELVIRHKLYHSEKKPRVILLPKSKDELTFLKVYTSNENDIIEIDFLEALYRYGAPIPSEIQVDVKPHLSAYIKDWLDEPLSIWRNFLSSGSKALLTENDVLAVLSNTTFSELAASGKFDLFQQIVVDDYGLPDPRDSEEIEWRKKSIASMIYTEAYDTNPKNPPSDSNLVIYPENQRKKILHLLDLWKKRTDYFPYFESLCDEADQFAQLQYWANSIELDLETYSSRLVEETILQNEIMRLTKLLPRELCQSLSKKKSVYQKHAESFWGKTVSSKIDWKTLLEYSETAETLYENEGIENKWSTTNDAVHWYIRSGWKVDAFGEHIFKERSDLPGTLFSIRSKLRKAHHRHTDRTNLEFSQLIDKQGIESIEFDDRFMDNDKLIKESDKIAFIFIDALRFELGKRLCEKVNQGEPIERAVIVATSSSIPTITSLGMALALPGEKDLEVTINNKKNGFRIVDKSNEIIVDEKAGRKQWLKKYYDLTESSFIDIDDLLDVKNPQANKKLGKKLFIFGKDFDEEGHQGKLQITGAENLVDRYFRTIRMLRNLGYTNIVIVTDHGYFHWEPEDDEIEIKPEGEILLSARRYAIGNNLQSQAAIRLKVSNSNIECLIPRSVNIFKTYGGMGFYHGGITLQEYIIPVLKVEWPKKSTKVQAVLKPITEITSLNQRVEIEPGVTQHDLMGRPDENTVSRRVFVKVENPINRTILFKSDEDHLIEPGGVKKIVELKKIEGAEAAFNSEVNILVCDSENEQVLDQRKVMLKVQLDEWY